MNQLISEGTNKGNCNNEVVVINLEDQMSAFTNNNNKNKSLFNKDDL